MRIGVNMGSNIINTNNIKSVKSNCNKCSHYSKDRCYLYGYKPNKKMCKRYYIEKIIGGNRKKPKVSKSERIENYKKGLIDTTIL